MMRICLEWSVDRDHVAKYSAHQQVICIFWKYDEDLFETMMKICSEWSVDRVHVAKYSAHHQVICIFWNAAADFLPATIIYPVTQREIATYSTWDLWKGVSWSINWCMCGRTVVFHQWVLPFGRKWHKKVWQIMTGYPPPYFVLPNHTVCAAHWPTVIRHLIYSFQPRCKAGGLPPGR